MMAKKKAARKRTPRKAPAQKEVTSASEQLERELVASALAKRQRGEKPTHVESRALKRFEREREERLRWQYYRTIPKKHWTTMTGLQHNQLKRISDRWGVPYEDSVVDLQEFLRSVHSLLQMLAKSNVRLERTEDGSTLSSSSVLSTEDYWRWKAENERLKFEERIGSLCPAKDMQRFLNHWASRLRELGTRLYQIKPEAGDVFAESLEDVEESLDEFFGSNETASEET